jgi:hypothetical protein
LSTGTVPTPSWRKRNRPSIAGLDWGNIIPMGTFARFASLAHSARFTWPARAAALLAPLGLAGPALVGCQSGSNVSAVYTVPASLDDLSEKTFFDQPWPNDLRVENASPRLEGYYNPKGFPILAAYIDSMKGVLDGFSPAAAGYLRFTGAIDPATLPANPHAALDPGASVQLIDIDPVSPEHGQRKLVSLRFQSAEGVYYLAHTLAFMPTIGFPLRPHTRYALVVTDRLQAAGGGSIAQSPTVAELVGVASPSAGTQVAHRTLAPAVDEIVHAGIDRANIVHLAVFTTADPTKELAAVRDAVATTIVPPTAYGWTLAQDAYNFLEYQGAYGPSPNYQSGTLPYTYYGDGGDFQYQDGVPIVQDTFDARFSLAVPNPKVCPMPAAGYPIVLYAHGTGGDWRSYIDDGTARILSRHCLASMGVDQIFHGTRPGAPPTGDEGNEGLLFYNFQNPLAARTNGRQSAIDEVQRARLFTETHLVVPATIASTMSEIHFDPSKLMYFGHSQGGLNGPLFTAVDSSARGAVFSGSGAMIAIALLEKTKPTPSVADLVKTLLLGLTAADEGELDEFHPAISLIQSIIDVEDPLHYGRLQATEPRSGFAAKSIYMTEGVNPDGTGDSYAPPHGIEAHALAIGLPVELPEQRAIAESQWGGPQPVTIEPPGLQGNIGGGQASGVLGQWAVPPGKDGHFVVFNVSKAQEQAAQFLLNLAADPKGLVPPP